MNQDMTYQSFFVIGGVRIGSCNTIRKGPFFGQNTDVWREEIFTFQILRKMVTSPVDRSKIQMPLFSPNHRGNCRR